MANPEALKLLEVLKKGVKVIYPFGGKQVALQRHGCANRMNFNIVVTKVNCDIRDPPIEVLGSYDSLPNSRGEKLVAVDFDRLKFWLGQGVVINPKAATVLGLSGFVPVHPDVYKSAWENRRKERLEKEAQEKTQNTEEKVASAN